MNLRLPEDCHKALGVDITFDNQAERTKMLTYLSQDGRILSREYPEGFIGRHSGWRSNGLSNIQAIAILKQGPEMEL